MTGSTSSLPTAFERLAGVVLLAGALAGCSATPFPDCCTEIGVRDVPYLTTYRFNFRTGSFDIVTPNPDRFFGILTQADVLTLMNAAAVTQSTTLGLVSGTLSGPRGPLREASVVVTDAEGNIVTITDGPFRNFFYNSLGQVPDFVISEGTTDQGSFTLFNAPPGELFLQLVDGGRGNGRIAAHAGAVSIGRFGGLEALPPTVGVLAIVQDAFTRRTAGNVVANFFAWDGGPQIADANGLFVTGRIQGLPTQSTGLLRLAAPNHRTTLLRLDLSMGRVSNRQQAFDPLTLDNVNIYPESGLQAWAAQVGVSIPLSDPIQPSDSGIIVGRVRISDGTGVTHSVVTSVDRDGQPLGARGKVFYLGLGGTVGGAVDPNLTETDVGGGYVLFIESCVAIPGGTVYLSAAAKTVTLPQSLNTSTASAPCIPGGVFVQDLVGQAFQSTELFFTASLQGRVNSIDATPVPGAQVQFLGVPPDPVNYVTDGNGAYQIPRGALPGAITPLLALSPYTARISKPGYVTTYVEIVTGLDGGRQDLPLLPEAFQQAACGANGTLNVYGVVRDLGMVDPLRQGLPAEGVTLAVLDEKGQPPSQGRIVYYQSPSQERTGLDGVFAVCDLAPPPSVSFPLLYQLRVISQDDSGAMPLQVLDDGASVVTLVVNKAFPREIATTGQVVALLGPEGAGALPAGGATLSVRGTKLTRTTDTDGRFGSTLPLPGNGRYVVRAEREGYLPTFNYQIATPARLRQVGDIYQLAPVKIAAKSDFDREGIPWSAEDGIVAGKVVVPGFGAKQSLVDGFGSPVAIFSGFFNPDDAYPDLLSVFADHVDFRYGDGASNLDGVGGVHPPRNVPLTIANGTLQITAAEPADLNADGTPDFAAISDGKLYVFFGNNAGAFNPGQEIALPGQGGTEPVAAYAVNIVDVDQDGRFDLLVATSGVNGGNPIARFISKVGSSFELRDRDPVGDACGSHRPRALATEFTGGLGLSAIVIADEDGTLCVYPINADGSPLAVQTLTLPAPPVLMRPAFLDADEISDVLILHQQGFGVLLGVQNQVEPPPPIEIVLPNGFSPNSMMIGDVNRDGRNDVLISGQGGILFYLGAGNGRFNAPTLLSESPATELTSVGLDDDGRPDLIASERNGALVQFRGADLALPGVELEARDEIGRLIGTVRYLNEQGVVEAQGTATTSSGRFVMDSLPPGFVMVRVRAGGSGNSLVTAYPGSVSYAELSANPLPGTIKVFGQTLDPLVTETSGTVAEGILITPWGTGTQVRSSCCNGPTDPFTAAFELPLDANSEYILKLQP